MVARFHAVARRRGVSPPPRAVRTPRGRVGAALAGFSSPKVAARRQGRCRTKPRHACEPSRPSSQSTTRPRSCAPGRAVVDSTVNLAIHGLLTPALAPAAPVSGHDTPTAASQRADTDVDGQDLDDDEDPEAVHELHDRLNRDPPSPGRSRRRYYRGPDASGWPHRPLPTNWPNVGCGYLKTRRRRSLFRCECDSTPRCWRRPTATAGRMPTARRSGYTGDRQPRQSALVCP
jgi:hypothetical protein